MKNTKTKKTVYGLCEAALMIALAVVFSLLRFPPFRIDLWANGGSIDFVMIPIIILGWRKGVHWAIPAGLILGLLECLIGGGIGWGLPSVLLDYVLAYGAVGLAGIFRNKNWGLFAGAAVASVARFACHFLSGITIWKLAVGDSVDLFGMTFGGETAYLYSLIYNGSYMLGNMIIALAVVALLTKPLQKLPE
jgi:thiamine transporter